MARLLAAMMEHGRATEWLTSSVLLAIALSLAVPGDTLASSNFGVLRRMGFDEAALVAPIALLASSRLIALFINGAWKRSPVLRMVGAVLGAGMFGALAVSFAYPWLVGEGRLSTGPGTYAVLALFDVLAAYRSGADVRLARYRLA